MKSRVISCLILSFSLTSCFFVDDIFDPPTPEEPSLQELSEKSVQSFLSKKQGVTYMPYGFSEIKINKPIEIIELEALQKQKQEQSLNNANLDLNIAQKKLLIEENNIERTVVVDHFFTFTDAAKQTTVYETTFTLNDTLGVKDLRAKIKQEIEPDYVSILSFFFYEKPIFLGSSFQESKILSQNFYAFFKAELERKELISDKSSFLLHALEITREIKIKGEFQQQNTLERMVTNFITKERGDIENYKNIEFSNLFETKNEENESVQGYYFFHKFMGKFDGTLDTNVVLIEFNPFYQIDEIYQMDRPFAPYFKN